MRDIYFDMYPFREKRVNVWKMILKKMEFMTSAQAHPRPSKINEKKTHARR